MRRKTGRLDAEGRHKLFQRVDFAVRVASEERQLETASQEGGTHQPLPGCGSQMRPGMPPAAEETHLV